MRRVCRCWLQCECTNSLCVEKLYAMLDGICNSHAYVYELTFWRSCALWVFEIGWRWALYVGVYVLHPTNRHHVYRYLYVCEAYIAFVIEVV